MSISGSFQLLSPDMLTVGILIPTLTIAVWDFVSFFFEGCGESEDERRG